MVVSERGSPSIDRSFSVFQSMENCLEISLYVWIHFFGLNQ